MPKLTARTANLPWLSALHIALLTAAAVIHQRPELLRPVLHLVRAL